MRLLTANDMLKELSGILPGSLVFVSYEAGGPPTERAKAESARHSGPKRYFTGIFQRVWLTNRKEWVMRIFAFNRDTIRNGIMTEGAFRTFNPAYGNLVLIDVINAENA
jgi:hypothetical protein